MKYKLKPGSFDRIRFRLPKTPKMHPDFKKILANYRRYYPPNEGTHRFYVWLKDHELDPSKPYLVQAQLGECLDGLCESFRWVQPYIQRYMEDEDAVYWKALALTANLSMNRNDYTNLEELQKRSPSLSYRPLDLNHDPALTLPFPENRVDLAEFEDKGCEAIVRITRECAHPLTGKLINDMIRDKEILHVSINGEPLTVRKAGDTNIPSGYKLLKLSLLERNVTLPGDPLTFLQPLIQEDEHNDQRRRIK